MVTDKGAATCSICLEPLRTYHAKILPCHHTVCVRCLAGLAKREEMETSTVLGQDCVDEGGRSAISVTCPTCHIDTHVPAGGVTVFETYVDTSSEEEDGGPVLCHLCDGKQKAHFQCSKCQNNDCSQCQCAHDKLCQGGQVTALPDPSNTSRSAQKAASGQMRQHLKMVEDALRKLSQEESQLEQDIRAMADSIDMRYEYLLGQACGARYACWVSLKEASDGLTERLHSQIADAWHTWDTFHHQLEPSQPAPVSPSEFRAAVFLQGDLPIILNRSVDGASLLTHQMEQSASLMINSLQTFMGKIVTSSQFPGPAQSKGASGSLSLQDDREDVSSEDADLNTSTDPYWKIEELADQVSWLQSSNNQLSQHVRLLCSDQSALQRELSTVKEQNATLTRDQAALQREVSTVKEQNATLTRDKVALQREVSTVKEQNATLTRDKVALQREVSTVKEQNATLTRDQAALQREVSTVKEQNATLTRDQAAPQREARALKDKNVIVHQDLAELTSDKDKVGADLAQLDSRVVTMQTQLSSQQTALAQLRSDHAAVLSQLTAVQSDVTASQGGEASVKTEVSQLKTDCAELKSDLAKVQGNISDLNKLNSDLAKVQGNISDLNKLNSDLAKVQGKISDLNKLKSDLTTSNSQVTSLEQRVQSAQDSVQGSMKALTALEARFFCPPVTANTQVGFSADLSEDMTTSKEQTLICDTDFCNVGVGYNNNGQTGMFTDFWKVGGGYDGQTGMFTDFCKVGVGYDGQTGMLTAPVAGCHDHNRAGVNIKWV